MDAILPKKLHVVGYSTSFNFRIKPFQLSDIVLGEIHSVDDSL